MRALRIDTLTDLLAKRQLPGQVTEDQQLPIDAVAHAEAARETTSTTDLGDMYEEMNDGQ